jgi:hypothetical protein
MRGLVRLVVVGFTVVSLMLVGVVGVSATSTSGKAESAKAFNSVVTLVSSHFDQNVTTKTNNGKDNTNNGKDKEVGLCHAKKDHKHATPGHTHHPCPGDHDGDEPESPG